VRLRLDPRDAERLGCEPVIKFVMGDVTVAEVEELSDRFEFDPYDWPHPFLGEIAFEDAGNPDAKAKAPRWQQRAVVWLTLRQAGLEVSWEQAGGVRAQTLGFLVDEEEPGKDPEPSPESEGSTTQPSESSGD
jgi:hypothetical protein